jgi:CheY-like chemotaxis protein
VLPFAIAEPATLRHALLFLIDAMMQEQPDAGALSIEASNSSNDYDDPAIQIAITIECDAPAQPPGTRKRRGQDWQLALLAARTLLEGLHAQLDLRPQAHGATTAIVTLDATSSEAPEPPPPPVEPNAHAFGGVLVLESDRAVRELLARALEPTGRNLFTCADGSAARALFERTPERFELLILEQDARQEPGELLAAQALEAEPGCKVLLVTPGATSSRLPRTFPRRCTVISKPFGLTELREALAELMPVALPR